MADRNYRSNSAKIFLALIALSTGTADAAAQSLEDARAMGRQRSTFINRTTHAPKASIPEPNLDVFRSEIQPILRNACIDCHGADTQEGNIRIDTLDPNLLKGKDVDWWLEVQAVLTKGEMPPPDASELSDSDRGKIIEWLSNEIQTASTVRRTAGNHSSFRRMTRYEFNYSLQDLLGLPYDFAKDLPPEANSEDGFQNSSELLHMSVSQLESYRQLARKALLRATVRGERPTVRHWSVPIQEASRIDRAKQQKEFDKATAAITGDDETKKAKLAKVNARFSKTHSTPYYKNLTTGRTVPASWSYGGAKYAIKPTDSPSEIPTPLEYAAILPRGRKKLTIELGNQVPDEGTMRVRVRASRLPNESSSPPSLQLWFGWQASNEGRALLRVGEVDKPISANVDAPKFYQWDIPLGEIYPRNSVRNTSKLGSMPSPSEYIRLANSSVSQGSIQIDYVEIAAPIYDEWPPQSHKRIFHDSENRDNESAYAHEILSTFMTRAWRRNVSEDELNRKLKLFERMRPQCEDFEETIVEVLATVLASPQFLYTAANESDNKTLAAHELATRLSLLLWSSLPDAELSKLASDGRLNQPEVLADQVTRMLTDSRSQRFAQHFVHQWLDMQLLDYLTVARHFDSLKEAMQQEPIAFFREVMRTDASVLDFLHADYTMANERLALHYAVPNVRGNHFRRIKLAPAKRRGGLLTQSGLLAMNSAGEDSHPLKRGVWLLESLLNDPPPPPPPAVPEIDLADPEIAKLTLKEQIEDHRNHPACMSCHAKIDPWGIAFENYDALGRWRTQVKGKPIDAASELFNNQKLDGMDGLKRFLLENRQDQFVRAMVHKLSTYALGRPLSFSDYSAVDEITAKVRKEGDGLATMITLIVQSELFRSK